MYGVCVPPPVARRSQFFRWDCYPGLSVSCPLQLLYLDAGPHLTCSYFQIVQVPRFPYHRCALRWNTFRRRQKSTRQGCYCSFSGSAYLEVIVTRNLKSTRWITWGSNQDLPAECCILKDVRAREKMARKSGTYWRYE